MHLKLPNNNPNLIPGYYIYPYIDNTNDLHTNDNYDEDCIITDGDISSYSVDSLSDDNGYIESMKQCIINDHIDTNYNMQFYDSDPVGFHVVVLSIKEEDV